MLREHFIFNVVEGNIVSQTLKVVAHLQVQAEQVHKALPIFKQLVEQVRQEMGCISYVLLQSTTDAAQFTFVEEWTNEHALAQHADTLHVGIALEQLTPLLAGAPNIQTYFEV